MTAFRIYATETALWLDAMPAPFVPGSLRADLSQDGSTVRVSRLDGSFIFAMVRWQDVADGDGATFTTADLALSYVRKTCARAIGQTASVTATAAPGADGLLMGAPVALSRATGQIEAARADTYALSFLAGLAEADIAAGFQATAGRSFVERVDWSPVTGVPALAVGQPYFLGPSGGLTLTPDRTPGAGLSLVRVGIALSLARLAFTPTDPILL